MVSKKTKFHASRAASKSISIVGKLGIQWILGSWYKHLRDYFMKEERRKYVLVRISSGKGSINFRFTGRFSFLVQCCLFVCITDSVV